ncbi:MAG: hypothetical protein WCF54_06420 [Terracidiphilus sp.]
MTLKSIERCSSFLALVILMTILWYESETCVILTGVTYLIAAAFMICFCMFNVLNVKVQLKKNPLSQSIWLVQTRARIMLLVAWQLAITGIFNIWSTSTFRLFSILLLSNILFIVSAFTWDRLISIADNPNQDGGARSLSVLGRPRSRRLFFWAFFVYPSISLVIADVMIFANGKDHPTLFDPPQICLLTNAYFSIGAAGLIFQRYRGVTTNQIHKPAFILIGLLVVGLATSFQLFTGWIPYLDILSGVIVFCTALCVHWLWRTSNSSLSSPST